jgi:hypothetical protein
MYTYVKTAQAKPPWDQLLCSEWVGVQFTLVKLSKISYIETLFNIQYTYKILVYSGFGLDRLHCTIHKK